MRRSGTGFLDHLGEFCEPGKLKNPVPESSSYMCVDAMFVGILLRDLARNFRVVFRELAPSRVLRNQFACGKNYREPRTLTSEIDSWIEQPQLCISYYYPGL